MGLRLSFVEHLPAALYRRYLLRRLARATAEAFGTRVPDMRGKRFADCLAEYAEFTAGLAGDAAADELSAKSVKERLHRNAATLGTGTRRGLGIRRPEQALRALELLYRQIGIQIKGRPDGRIELEFSRCLFAAHYPPSACRVMSALDAGLVDGLFGGAGLDFSERLTEGRPCCRAAVTLSEARS